MPELPEVQTIVNDLNKKIIGRRIRGVWFDWGKIITLQPAQAFGSLGTESSGRTSEAQARRGDGERRRTIKKPTIKVFERKIKGAKIESVSRRGKNILIYLTNDKRQKTNDFLLLIHPKMTGHLLYGKWKIEKVVGRKSSVISLVKGPLREKVNNYIHLIFYLDNGLQLGLSDLRKFAKVLFGTREEIENLPELKKMGPEPLDAKFTFLKFKEIISRQKRKIKQVLMDPYVIAGIGNIYSDDILWQAKVHSLKPANKLKADELKALFLATRQVLKKALKLRGTSISDFRDTAGRVGFYGDKRLVYQREGTPCLRCQTRIKRVKIGGRSAHFCPKCQKLAND